MTEPERDALYARVFATRDGKLVLEDIGRQRNYRFLLWSIRLRIERMRERWAGRA